MASLSIPTIQPISPFDQIQKLSNFQLQQAQLQKAEAEAQALQRKTLVENETRSAMAQALNSGNPELVSVARQRLGEINPKALFRLEERDRTLAGEERKVRAEKHLSLKDALEQSEMEDAEIVKELNAAKNRLVAVKSRPPEERLDAIEKLGAKGVDMTAFNDIQPTDEAIDEGIAELDDELLARQGPEQFDPESPEGKLELDLENSFRLNRDPASIERLAAAAKIKAEKRSGFIIKNYMGGDANLTKASSNFLQKRQIAQSNAMIDLLSMDAMNGQIDEHLSAAGRLWGWVYGTADYFNFLRTDAGTKFLRERQDLFTVADNFFNNMRRFITGAAAPETELKRLAKMFPNRDMSPEVFKAARDALKRTTLRAYRMRQFIMESGFSGDKDELHKRLAELWKLPEATTKSQKFVESRVHSLILDNSKVVGTVEQKQAMIMKKLKQEGYLETLEDASKLDWDRINEIAATVKAVE